MCWSTISFYFKTFSSTVLPLDIPCRFEVSSRRLLWIYPLAFQPYYWAYFILRFFHTVCMPKHAHNIVDSLFNLHLSVECTSFWKWFDYSFHLLLKEKTRSIAAQNIFMPGLPVPRHLPEFTQWLRLDTPMQGAWVWSLVGELDPTCPNWDSAQANKMIINNL